MDKAPEKASTTTRERLETLLTLVVIAGFGIYLVGRAMGFIP